MSVVQTSAEAGGPSRHDLETVEMITEAPVAAALKFTDLDSQVRSFLATARIASVGGLTWAEFGQLTAALVQLTATTLDSISTLTGPQKRELVLEAVATLFDQIAIRAVPMPAGIIWRILRPAVRSLVISLAAGILEQLLPLLRSSST